MSNEAKIGIGVAVVALVAILWFAIGRRDDGGTAEQKVAKAGAGPSKSDRVRERLAQLRGERVVGGAKLPGAAGKPGFPSKLPTPAFGALGDPAYHAVIDATPGADEDLDFDTLREMALIDEDPDNRIAAIWLLASLDDEEPVLPVLTQALSDPDPEVRMAAIQALSEFSEETPIDSLQTALQDSDAEIRFEALSIAAEMTDQRVQPLIQQALDDPDEDVRSLAEGLADLEDTYDDAPTPAAEATPEP